MNTKQAKEIIETAYSAIIQAAAAHGDQTTRHDIEAALKLEIKESHNHHFTQPKHRVLWAKAGIAASILSGADGRWTVAGLGGIRDAHVKAIIIGARHSDLWKGLGLNHDLIEGAKTETW